MKPTIQYFEWGFFLIRTIPITYLIRSRRGGGERKINEYENYFGKILLACVCILIVECIVPSLRFLFKTCMIIFLGVTFRIKIYEIISWSLFQFCNLSHFKIGKYLIIITDWANRRRICIGCAVFIIKKVYFTLIFHFLPPTSFILFLLALLWIGLYPIFNSFHLLELYDI